jgi:hypothetical protein
MATVTRTLKNGGDTGKLDRAEVRAVTAAIAEGRTADVLSGAVLKQFRAARKRKSMPDYDVGVEDAGIRRVGTKTADVGPSTGRVLTVDRKGKSIPKAIRRRADGKIVSVTVSSERAASEKGKAASRSKK